MADDKKPPVIIQNPRRRLEGEGAHADRRLADRELQRLRTTFIEMGGLAEARRRVVRSDGTLIEAISRNNHDGHGHGPLEEVRVVRNPIPPTPSQCKFTLESGLLDCLDTGLNSSPAKAADTLYPVPNVDNATYPVGFSAKDNGALTVDMWFGLVQPKTSKALPGDAASGFHIAKQKGMSNLPASVFTGKTKLWVQALYGLPATVSEERYRFLDFGDESVLIFRWYKGKTLVERAIGWDFGRTDVVYTAPDYSYWLVSFLGSSNLATARVEYCAMQLSPCGELLRKWLVANIQAVQNNLLAGLSLERIEAFLLSQVVALGDPVMIAGSEPVMVAAAIKGGPVGYGWKAKRDGSRVSVVHFRQVNTPGGLPGYFQTDLSHIDIAYNGALPVNQRFSITPSLGNAPKNFTLSGYQQIWRPVGNTLVAYRVNFAAVVAVADAYVYGFYNDADSWIPVKVDISKTLSGARLVKGYSCDGYSSYSNGLPYNEWWCAAPGSDYKTTESYNSGTASGFTVGADDFRAFNGNITRETEGINRVSIDANCITEAMPTMDYLRCIDKFPIPLTAFVGCGFGPENQAYEGGNPNSAKYQRKYANYSGWYLKRAGGNVSGYSSLVVPKGDSSAVYVAVLKNESLTQTLNLKGQPYRIPYESGIWAAYICIPESCESETTQRGYTMTYLDCCCVIHGGSDQCGNFPKFTSRSWISDDSRQFAYPHRFPPYVGQALEPQPSVTMAVKFIGGSHSEQIADTYTSAWDRLFVVSIADPTYSNPFFTTSSYVSGDVFHWGDVAVNEYKIRGDYTVTPTVGWRFVGWA